MVALFSTALVGPPWHELVQPPFESMKMSSIHNFLLQRAPGPGHFIASDILLEEGFSWTTADVLVRTRLKEGP